MSRTFRANTDFRTPFIVLQPKWVTDPLTGAQEKAYEEINEISEKDKQKRVLWCRFKSYGGKEMEVNGIYSIIDTAQMECWYTPEVKRDSAIMLLDTNAVYEVINEPEDINMEHYRLQFRVRRVKSGG